MTEGYWHGGIPGLRPGDLIQPGHARPGKSGCAICEARARQADGGGAPAIDGLALHADRVYITTNRLNAKHYASLYGRGWLYRVTPVGDFIRSTEDTIETYAAEAARVESVYDRAVLLTMSERRRIYREWTAADSHAGKVAAFAYPKVSDR